MKIGIDLDGVIFDSEKEFRVYSELYDMIDLKQNSKLDNKELKFQKSLLKLKIIYLGHAFELPFFFMNTGAEGGVFQLVLLCNKTTLMAQSTGIFLWS